MVQIYDLDSDTEGLQLARGLDDDGAVFAASSDATQGIRMTPKIPPSFDGTTSWFEYEDLIDDWLLWTRRELIELISNLSNL